MENVYIILVRGLGGSGKTTLSTALAKRLKFPVFNRDDVKTSIKKYELDFNLTTEIAYSVMNDLAFIQIKNGISVLLDANARFQSMENNYIDFCKVHNAKLITINCFCSNKEEWGRRILDRGDSHPVSFQETQSMVFQEFKYSPQLMVDTTKLSKEASLEHALNWLSKLGIIDE